MKIWQRWAIRVLSIGGGLLGIIAACIGINATAKPIEWLFGLVFIAIYLWGIWCGVRFTEGNLTAERGMIKYWLIQVPTFGSPFLGYFLSSGLHFTVSLQFEPSHLNFGFLIGSTFNYSLLQPNQPWFVGINLFALAIFSFLISERRQRSLSQQSLSQQSHNNPQN